ncbi:hypothetical protein LEMLEM_LOCUS7212 [Lemmus lemmus]
MGGHAGGKCSAAIAIAVPLAACALRHRPPSPCHSRTTRRVSIGATRASCSRSPACPHSLPRQRILWNGRFKKKTKAGEMAQLVKHVPPNHRDESCSPGFHGGWEMRPFPLLICLPKSAHVQELRFSSSKSKF